MSFHSLYRKVQQLNLYHTNENFYESITTIRRSYSDITVQTDIANHEQQHLEKLKSFLQATLDNLAISDENDLRSLEKIIADDGGATITVNIETGPEELLQLPAQINIDDLKEDGALLTPEQKELAAMIFEDNLLHENIIIAFGYPILRTGDDYYVLYNKDNALLGKGAQAAGVCAAQRLNDNTWHAVKFDKIDGEALIKRQQKAFAFFHPDCSLEAFLEFSDRLRQNKSKLEAEQRDSYSSEAAILKSLGHQQATASQGKSIVNYQSSSQKQSSHPESCQSDKDSSTNNLPASNTASADTSGIYIPMQYAAGTNLSKYTELRILSPAQLIELASKMGEEIQSIHGKGILHRDIKLDNYVFDAIANKLALVDYSLSRESDKDANGNPLLQCTANKAGTPTYMAPELANNAVYNEATEVYAYGVSLASLLNFDAPTTSTHIALLTIDRLKETKPEWPEPVLKEIHNLLTRMLHKNPGQRPRLLEIVSAFKELESYSIQLLSKIRNVAVVPITEVTENLKQSNQKYFDLLGTFDTVWLQDSANTAPKKINFNNIITELQQRHICVAGVLRASQDSTTQSAISGIPLLLERKESKKNINVNSYYYLSKDKALLNDNDSAALKEKGLNVIEVTAAKKRKDYIKEIVQAPVTSLQYDKIIAGLFAEQNRLQKKYQSECPIELFNDPVGYLRNNTAVGSREKTVARRIINIRNTMKSLSLHYKEATLNQQSLRTELTKLQHSMFHTNSLLKLFNLFKPTDGAKKIKALIKEHIDDTCSVKINPSTRQLKK